MIINNGQQVTRYIKHLADGADFKGDTFNKYCSRLIGNRFEMPNISYTSPLCIILDERNEIKFVCCEQIYKCLNRI